MHFFSYIPFCFSVHLCCILSYVFQIKHNQAGGAGSALVNSSAVEDESKEARRYLHNVNKMICMLIFAWYLAILYWMLKMNTWDSVVSIPINWKLNAVSKEQFTWNNGAVVGDMDYKTWVCGPRVGHLFAEFSMTEQI